MKMIFAKEFILSYQPSIEQMIQFVRTAKTFYSKLYFYSNGVISEGKDLSEVISFFLLKRKNESISLIAQGKDARKALYTLAKLISLQNQKGLSNVGLLK